MDQYIVEGSFPVKGEITASGNKNAALPCIAATLLTSDCVTLTNVPEIEDVHVMLSVLSELGSSVERGETRGTYHITTTDIRSGEIPL
ncbi:MAG: UDP-N-acetylglucosamine 1-carboxyvinyltransferase, partial [Spirochaetes bacterium]|nr:UDP-N-acetylglucosamine 1-carboxyvinyltransferase [Spirochaetota bacterium]